MSTSATAFTYYMRGGLYDTLWIAGDQSVVGDTLTNEINEIVYNGATLIVDGAPSQCNPSFDALGGIASRGSLTSNQSVKLSGSFTPTAQTLATVGSANSFTLITGSSAQVQATYSVTANGKTTTPAAMVSNQIGAGRTIIAGFDLGTTLVTQAANWTPALGTTLNAATPVATASLTPGQYLPVQTTIVNQGNATALDVQTAMPASAQYLGSAPSASLIAGSGSNIAADWDFNLALTQSNTLDLSLRAPATGGSYNLQTTVGTVANGSTTPYGNVLPFPFVVTPAATHAATATTALQGLSLTVKNDQSLRTTLIANLNQAMGNFNLNTYTGYGTAIGQLVGISGSLSSFSSTVTTGAGATTITGIHAEIDRILQEAQWRWTLLQPEISSSLTIDKNNCGPSDTVTLAESLTNVTINTTLSNLKVITTVTGPGANGSGSGSTSLFSKTETLAQLAVGAKQSYSYPVAIGQTVAPGSYTVTMTVQDANGNTLATSTGQFTVASTATTGAGLSGTIVVAPTQVPAGSTAVLTITATDQGNAALNSLPLTVNIINTATQKSVAQFPYSPTLAIGGVFTGSSSWAVVGNAGTNYQAQLIASLGSLNLQLAQANFTIIAPPVQLSISQAPAAWQNLLVYSACKRATDGLLGLCGTTTLPVDNPSTLASCDSSRATMLDQTLSSLNINHSIATSGSDFLAKLRSGQYNSYWISNGATVLPEPAASELRAAITRGNGLIVDGIDGGLSPTLSACAGVAYKASYATSEPLSITGKLYTPGSITITNAPVQLSSNSATTVQATLGSGSSATPGIVEGSYANGKTLAFGFDWASAMGTTGSSKLWPAIAQASMGYVTPSANGSTVLPGTTITLATTVQNTGQATSVQVVQTIPAGATILGASPAAQVSGNTITWSAASAAGVTSVFTVHLQAPTATGNYSIATAVNTVANSKATLYQSESYSFGVASQTQLMSQLITAVQTQAQTETNSQQQAASAAVLAQLTQAQTLQSVAHSQDEILRLLLAAQSRLPKFDSNGTLAPMLANLIAAVEKQGTP